MCQCVCACASVSVFVFVCIRARARACRKRRCRTDYTKTTPLRLQLGAAAQVGLYFGPVTLVVVMRAARLRSRPRSGACRDRGRVAQRSGGRVGGPASGTLRLVLQYRALLMPIDGASSRTWIFHWRTPDKSDCSSEPCAPYPPEVSDGPDILPARVMRRTHKPLPLSPTPLDNTPARQSFTDI